MKRISLIALLSFITLCCSAQMFVWKNGVVQYALRTSTADSITFYEPADYGEIHPVDLGLPSGIKWADKNLGATAPSEVGTPYAWGETETKETFTQGNYQFKYNWPEYADDFDDEWNLPVDVKRTLSADDDIATILLGPGWRIPTVDDYKELINSCTMNSSIYDDFRGCAMHANNGSSVFFPYNNRVSAQMWTSSILSGYTPWCFQVDPVYSGLASQRPYEEGYIRPVFDERIYENPAPNSFVFSVSPNDYITFSSGNLQYQAATNTFRFATHQYDYIGQENSYISLNYPSWIDLFEWGRGNEPYFACSDLYDDLFSEFDYSDFGSNSINGQPANMWRTLNSSEWVYLIHERRNASSLKGTALVNGVFGFILLPDKWNLPLGCSFTAIEDDGTTNQYSIAEWSMMESAGAVFLPAAGRRASTEINKVGENGFYWASDYYTIAMEDDWLSPSFLYIKPSHVYMCAGIKTQGFSVRLVKDYVE